MITKLDERTNILQDVFIIKEWLVKLNTYNAVYDFIPADHKNSVVDETLRRIVTDYKEVHTDNGLTITEAVRDGVDSKNELEILSEFCAFKDQITVCELIYQFCLKYTEHFMRAFCSERQSYEINYSKIEECVNEIYDKNSLQMLVNDTIEKGNSYTCLNFNILNQLANYQKEKEKERKQSNLSIEDLMNNEELKDIEQKLAIDNKRIYKNHFPIFKEICNSILQNINVWFDRKRREDSKWFERDKVYCLSQTEVIGKIFDDYDPNTFIDCINLITDVQLKVKNRCAYLMFALVYMLEHSLNNGIPQKNGGEWVKLLFEENHIVWDGNKKSEDYTGRNRYEQYKNKKSEYLHLENGQLVLNDNANKKIKPLYKTVIKSLKKNC